MKLLDHLSSQWVEVANRLPIPSPVVSSIQVSRLPSDQACLRRVIEWWFQNTSNPDWSTVQKVLQSTVQKVLQGNFALLATCQNYSCKQPSIELPQEFAVFSGGVYASIYGYNP